MVYWFRLQNLCCHSKALQACGRGAGKMSGCHQDFDQNLARFRSDPKAYNKIKQIPSKPD
ncbi:hypothetical protein Hanom_Chr07g00580501 [Helianthus anomalus]